MFDLDHIFMHHTPTAEQLPKYQALRDAAKTFAAKVVDLTPPSADQSAAVRHIREAVMTANAAIALDGRLEVPRHG
jgi:hypothetical protein